MYEKITSPSIVDCLVFVHIVDRLCLSIHTNNKKHLQYTMQVTTYVFIPQSFILSLSTEIFGTPAFVVDRIGFPGCLSISIAERPEFNQKNCLLYSTHQPPPPLFVPHAMIKIHRTHSICHGVNIITILLTCGYEMVYYKRIQNVSTVDRR